MREPSPRAAGSSPHTRGARGIAAVVGGPEGIIPAYAGSTVIVEFAAAFHSDHPRIRGEHVDREEAGLYRDGSSPHTRGAPDPAARPDTPRRIIPAYAGSTPANDVTLAVLRDHPRIRGEHASIA